MWWALILFVVQSTALQPPLPPLPRWCPAAHCADAINMDATAAAVSAVPCPAPWTRQAISNGKPLDNAKTVVSAKQRKAKPLPAWGGPLTSPYSEAAFLPRPATIAADDDCYSKTAPTTTASPVDFPPAIPQQTLTSVLDTFTVCVYGEPIPLHRHMLSRGRMYNPSATQQKNFARASATFLPTSPLTGPLEAELRFFFSRPMNHYRTGKFAGLLRDDVMREGAWHSKRKDLDNLIKFVLDSLNGLAYLDDSQICSIVSSKCYAEEGTAARTEVRIRKLL